MLPYIQQYGCKLAKSLVKLSGKRLKYSDGRVHSYRLTVKKLRALLALLDTIHATSNRKSILEPVRKTYSKAGRYRDLQIHSDLLKSFGAKSPEEYRVIKKWISKAILDAKIDFNELIKSIGRDRHLELENRLVSVFKNYPNPITKNNIIDYTELRLKQILKYPRHPERVELHQIRKILKEVVYTLELSNNSYVGIIASPQAISVLNQIQEDMGRWNDWDNLEQTILNLNKKNCNLHYLAWFTNITRCNLQELLYKNMTQLSHIQVFKSDSNSLVQ